MKITQWYMKRTDYQKAELQKAAGVLIGLLLLALLALVDNIAFK